MKDHIQTVINFCFAISITAFIYQNNSQQDRLDKNLRFSLGVSETTYSNEENIKILFKNDNEVFRENFSQLFEAVKFNEERIIDNRRAVRDLAEIMLD